jgi:Fe2+ transport system protein FeoA
MEDTATSPERTRVSAYSLIKQVVEKLHELGFNTVCVDTEATSENELETHSLFTLKKRTSLRGWVCQDIDLGTAAVNHYELTEIFKLNVVSEVVKRLFDLGFLHEDDRQQMI